VYAFVAVTSPCDVSIVTVTVPAECGGVFRIMLDVPTETLSAGVAGTVPKATSRTPVKFFPFIVTAVPPVLLPIAGVIDVIDGVVACI
jgi:hypothetical protein